MNRIGILGSGVMGKQIALLFASQNYPVVVWNHHLRLEFEKTFRRLAMVQTKLGFISKFDVKHISKNVRYVNDVKGLKDCDIIFEAVSEDIGIKHTVYKLLNEVIDSSTLVASNTSALKISTLASGMKAPNRFIGVHFLNPPTSNKLVEITQSEQTSQENLDKVLMLLEGIGMHPVVLPQMPGYIVNRLLFPMINEAILLHSKYNIEPKTIDSCMKMGAHFPMGPLELADFIGLDLCLKITKNLFHETKGEVFRPPDILQSLVSQGRLGRKSGQGFYSYKKVR